MLLAADFNPWHNMVNPLDVDNDDHVKPLDALIVISELNRLGAMNLSESAASMLHSGGGSSSADGSEGEAAALPGSMVDTNGDGQFTPTDALKVLNALNSGEGENGDHWVKIDLTAVEDVVPNTGIFGTRNTPRDPVGTGISGDFLHPGDTFRIEVRVQDIRNDAVGVFAAFPDIWWDEAMAFSVPEIPERIPVQVEIDPPNDPPPPEYNPGFVTLWMFPDADPNTAGRQFNSDIEPNTRNQILDAVDDRIHGDPTKDIPPAQPGDNIYEPAILATAISFRNGDFGEDPDNPGQATPAFLYSTGPRANVSIPGLINGAGAIWLSGLPDTTHPMFLLDMQVIVESIIGVPDEGTVLENGTVTIHVLDNDSLNEGDHLIHVGGPLASTQDPWNLDPSTTEIGTETLVASDTGQGSGNDGSGFRVPDDKLELVGVEVSVDNPATSFSIQSFNQNPDNMAQFGTVSRVGNSLVYTPTADIQVATVDTFTYVVQDNLGNTKEVDVSVTVEPVDAAPVISAPSSVTMDENQTLSVPANPSTFVFSGANLVSVTETDGQDIAIELVAGSSITINQASGVDPFGPYDLDGSDGKISFRGTQAEVNSALSGLTYTPDGHFNGSAELAITAKDLAPADSSPIHSTTHTVSITVDPVNDRPVTNAPGAQSVDEDLLPLVFSTANGNAISVGDPLDIAPYTQTVDVTVRLELSVAEGAWNLVNPGTLTVEGGGTNVLKITGLTAQINAALGAGLQFSAPIGDYLVQYTTNDLGNVGGVAGQGLVDTGTIPVTVFPPERPFAANDTPPPVDEESDATEIDVLANDYNYENLQGGANLDITDVTQPLGGVVEIVVTEVDEGVFAGTSVTFKPNPDFAGQTSFTYTIVDTSFDAQNADPPAEPSTATVFMTVNQINDAPDFEASHPDAVDEDAGKQTIPNWADVADFKPDADPLSDSEDGQSVLAYHVTGVSNPDLFATGGQPTVSPAGTLTYTPADDANGSSTFEVAVQDNGGTANGGVDTSVTKTYTITVDAVNDAPTFTAVNPSAVNEDSGAQTVQNWASGFSAGPADEVDAGQTLDGYEVTILGETSPGLFLQDPAVDNAGTLTYTPGPDQFGTATISVTAKDTGGTPNGGQDTSVAKTFTITVDSVNDEPDFTASAVPLTSDEDQGQVTIPGWITLFKPDADPQSDLEDGQTVADYIVSVTADPDNLFGGGVAPDVSNGGQLTYTSGPEASGTAKFTVAVRDSGGTANGGDNLSQSREFTITVNSTNDEPVNLIDDDDNFSANNQSTDDGVDLAFNHANGNLLEITDVDDDGSDSYTLELSVIGGAVKGSLELGPTVPGSLLTADGNGTATIDLAGTRADINTAINGLTFKPAAGLNNEDVLITMTSSDGGASGDDEQPQGDTDTITIAVAPINDPPVANDDDVKTPEGTAFDFNVFVNNGHGVDSPGPNESFQDIDVVDFDSIPAALGTVELLNAETGAFRYTPPNGDFNGEVTFAYTIRDNGQSRIDGVIQDDFKEDSATVTITVTEVNDNPIAMDDLLLMKPNEAVEGNEVRFPVADLLANDLAGPANEDDQTLTVKSVTGANVALDGDEIVFTVPADFGHAYTFGYTVEDNGTTDGVLAPKTDQAQATIRDVVLSVVSGYVFADSDMEGDMDATELRIGGIRVTLSGTDLSDNDVGRTTLTDENGYFEFSGVMPNKEGIPYSLLEGQPMAWLDGTATPGTAGGVAHGSNEIRFNLPVTGVGADPDNSVAANYNFTEWGLMAQYLGSTVGELLHSGLWGGQNTAGDQGIVFMADATGELEWYIDVGNGWDDYIPGIQSPTDPHTYRMVLNGVSVPMTNERTDTVHNLNAVSNENVLLSFRGGAMIGRVLGTAEDNDLPADAGGEGEAYEAYADAVDAIFAESGLK